MQVSVADTVGVITVLVSVGVSVRVGVIAGAEVTVRMLSKSSFQTLPAPALATSALVGKSQL